MNNTFKKKTILENTEKFKLSSIIHSFPKTDTENKT